MWGPPAAGRPDALSLTALRGAHARRCRLRQPEEGRRPQASGGALDVAGRGEAGPCVAHMGQGPAVATLGLSAVGWGGWLRGPQWGTRARWRAEALPLQKRLLPGPCVLFVEDTGFAEHTAIPREHRPGCVGPRRRREEPRDSGKSGVSEACAVGARCQSPARPRRCYGPHWGRENRKLGPRPLRGAGAHVRTCTWQRRPGDHSNGHVVSRVCSEKLGGSAPRRVATEDKSIRLRVPRGAGLDQA